MQAQGPTRWPNRLRELRLEHGLKLYDVAALVRYDPSAIQRWETGETATIPDEIKLLLADHYGVSVEYLMRWDAREPSTEAAA